MPENVVHVQSVHQMVQANSFLQRGGFASSLEEIIFGTDLKKTTGLHGITQPITR